MVKEQGDKMEEDPGRGRGGGSCPETLTRQRTGSWLPLLEVDFRKTAAPWGCELFCFLFCFFLFLIRRTDWSLHRGGQE